MSQLRSIVRHPWFSPVLGIVISLVCLGWVGVLLLGNAGQRAQMLAAFQQADYRLLPVMWVTLFVFYWLKAWRWRMLLSTVGDYRPMQDLFGPIMIGFGFNNVLPARIGEFVRCYVFSRQQKVPLPVTISSLVLERIFDGIAIVFYLAIGLMFVPGMDPQVKQAALVFSGIACCIVLFSLCYVIWTKPIVACVEAILKALRFLPHSLVEKLCRVLEAGALGLAAIKNVRLVIAMLILSLIKWALNGLIMLLALWAFRIPANALHGMVLMGVTAFAVAVPSSPGFFGIIQAAFAAVGELFNFNPQAMLAASIFYHLGQWVPVTLTGLTYFAMSGLSLSQVRAAAPEPDGTEAVIELAPDFEHPPQGEVSPDRDSV